MPISASTRLALLLVAVHVAAIVAVIWLPAAWWLRLAGCSAVIISCAITVYRSALLRASDSVVGLQIRRDGSCHIQTRNRRLISGRVCSGWFVSPLMIVVQVACPSERLRRSITLLPDAAEADTLRRLRIFLRFAIEPSIRNK